MPYYAKRAGPTDKSDGTGLNRSAQLCIRSAVERGKHEDPDLKYSALLFCAIALLVSPVAAGAMGCIKGAAGGTVAGHFAGHHGKVGAAAGCAIGHFNAKAKASKSAQAPRK
jgi:hypothetical protein